MTETAVADPASEIDALEQEQRIAAISARRDAIHDGMTWSYSRAPEPWMGVFLTTGNGYTFPVARVFGGEESEDRHARFIAWAPSDIDYLLDRVQSLRAALQQSRADSKRLDWLDDNPRALEGLDPGVTGKDARTMIDEAFAAQQAAFRDCRKVLDDYGFEDFRTLSPQETE